MRLTELNPRWCNGSQWRDASGTIYAVGYEGCQPRHGMGMTFDCPTHRSHRLAVFFANPVDGFPPIDTSLYAPDAGKPLWQRTNDDFAVMSLSPSVDASVHGCWHGFIVNGEIS